MEKVLETRCYLRMRLKTLEEEKEYTESILLTANSFLDHTDERARFLFQVNYKVPKTEVFKSFLIKIGWCSDEDQLDTWTEYACDIHGREDSNKPVTVTVYRKEH